MSGEYSTARMDIDTYVNPVSPSVKGTDLPPLPTTGPKIVEEDEYLNLQKPKKVENPKTNLLKYAWPAVAIFLCVLVLILLVCVIVLQSKVDSISVNQPASLTSGISAKTCLEIDTKVTGLHYVQDDAVEHAVPVYCDMETDGGGWTLVASVHENDFKKCDQEDRWFQVGSTFEFIGNTVQWMNAYTFGSPELATNNDYKNILYSSYSEARDVMIWHVRHKTEMKSFRSSATFRYRTENHFLDDYGGNLKQLFMDHTVLEVKDDEQLVNVLSKIASKSIEITSQIDDWYSYDDTGDNRFIKDANLYATVGNELGYFTSNKYLGLDRYNANKNYSLSDSLSVMSVRYMQPYTAITMIRNTREDDIMYGYRVVSTRAVIDESEIISDTVSIDTLTVQYNAVVKNVNASFGIPSICELHYIVTDAEKWGSINPISFELDEESSDGTTQRHSFVARKPTNAVLGYFLLTRNVGKAITKTHIESVLGVVTSALYGMQLFRNLQNGPVVPVVFDQGTELQLRGSLPPTYRPYTKTGVVQFGAFDRDGFPNAICPGVEGGDYPEYLCIGGLSQTLNELSCGDFRGWEGESPDSTVRDEYANEDAHSRHDLQSVIMIFYR